VRRIFTFLLFALSVVSSIAVPVQVAWAQTGTQTFASKGTFNGKPYNAITLDYDNHWITTHFTDGTQFTQAITNEDMWNELARRYRSANPPPD
jgi:hypothetical protein